MTAPDAAPSAENVRYVMTFKHVVFNPNSQYGGISAAVQELGEQRWELVRVVPVHQHESVAVFQKAVAAVRSRALKNDGQAAQGEAQ